jgi:hypothetical protein
MNSLLFRAQYMRFWLRLRLRDILLTSELVVRGGNSIREQYIARAGRGEKNPPAASFVALPVPVSSAP